MGRHWRVVGFVTGVADDAITSIVGIGTTFLVQEKGCPAVPIGTQQVILCNWHLASLAVEIVRGCIGHRRWFGSGAHYGRFF